MSFPALLLTAGLLLIGMNFAHARPPEWKGKAAPAGEPSTYQETTTADRTLTESLRRAGIDVEQVRRIAREEGIAAQSTLPPGIQKNLARGKPLPPGIARRSAPESFTRRLPNYEGYDWRMAGKDLVLMQTGTEIVADVLVGAFD